MRLVKAGDTVAATRRLAFDIRGLDGISAATGEAGKVPQIRINYGAWTSVGVGALVGGPNGRYYAELAPTSIQNAGTIIESRYKDIDTAETPGESVYVVNFDPDADIGVIRDNVAAVKTDVSSIKAVGTATALAVSETKTKVTGLETAVGALTTKVDGMATELTVVKTAVDAIATKQTSDSAEIASIKTGVIALLSSLNSLKAALGQWANG